MSDQKVLQMPQQQVVPSGDGGDGREIERRLRAVELDVREIKTRLDHVATKEDLEKVKSLIEKKDAANSKWFLGITIGGIVTVLAALVRTFIG